MHTNDTFSLYFRFFVSSLAKPCYERKPSKHTLSLMLAFSFGNCNHIDHLASLPSFFHHHTPHFSFMKLLVLSDHMKIYILQICTDSIREISKKVKHIHISMLES